MDYYNQETSRLKTRKLTPEDVENWLAFFDNNDRLHFLGMDTSKDVNVLAKDWIFAQFDRYEKHDLGHLAIIEKATGNLVGLAGIIPRIMEDKPVFEVAYSYKPTEWGKGFATEMAQQMKRFGFDNNIADNLVSIIHKDNIGSMNVAIKNGMKIQGETHFMGMDVFIFGVKKGAK